MRLLIITSLVFTSLLSSAQQKIIGVAFLKFDGKYVTSRDSADFYRIVSERDSGSILYPILEYYKDGKRKLVGTTSKIDPPSFEGQCMTFYKSGKRESVKNYKGNSLVGDEYDFFPNGKLYLQIEYPDNGNFYNELEENYSIKANFDSLGKVLVENGNGYYKGYDAKFSYISEEGLVKDGKRSGIWKGTDKDRGISFEENYKDGILIKGNSIARPGDTAAYKTRATPPEFKGGITGFAQYLGGHIQYPDDARQNNIQGTVLLSFVVLS
jgi:antitoxin component YwqK of YwqJK toxin-antitoxin module